MKRLFLFLQIFVLATVVLAVPARPGVFFKVTQNDGTVLSVRLVGDEHMSYFVNEADGQKMFRDEDGDLKPLTMQHFMQMKTVATERRAMIEKARAERMAANRKATAARKAGGPHNEIGDFGSMTGSKKGLVILVNFKDKKFTKTRQNFDDQFNKVGYTDNNHIGSVHDYFYDQSYQQFDLDFDVVGPVTVSQNMKYYGAKSGSDNDSRPGTMVAEACNLVKDEVNFADYDWDGDGWVDQVFVVYAGYGEAQGGSSDTIWPHEWQLSSAAWYGDGEGTLYLDGVRIDTYACSCELSGSYGSTMDGIGTACHEFSHCLGYPDFYDIDYSGGWGMDSWDVMCGGSYNGYNGHGEAPCGYSSYERWMAGWLEPTVLEDGKTVTDMQPLNREPEAYIIYNDKNSKEYILLENRNNEKWFKYMPNRGSTSVYGLLAIHVDYDANAWAADGPNDDPNHQRMTIIPAGKKYDSNYTTHPFGGSSSVKALTETSHANAGGKWWTACSTGSKNLNHEITEITYNKNTRNLSFLFDGGDAADDGTRYTVTYVAGSGTCEVESWQQTEYREVAILPAAVGAKPDYYFVGWSKTDVNKATEMPELLQLGEKLKLDADIKLYAVYKYLYSPSSERSYKLSTTINKDKDYLFVSSNEEGDAYVLDLDSLSAGEGAVAPRVTIVRKGDDLVISNPAPTSVWECNYESGASTRRLVNDDRYMLISSSGIRYSESVTSISWSASSGLYAISGASRYYVHPNADGTFFVNKTTGNPVYAYELVGERPTVYYSNTFDYYTLTYLVDSVQYKQFILEAGSAIEPIEEPEAREGYTFSGWIDVPEVMPAEDTEVYGSFAINSYLASFVVDGDTIQSDTLEYGAPIVAPINPEKEGYLFVAWNPEVDEFMPAHDVCYEAVFEEDPETAIATLRSLNAPVAIYSLQGILLHKAATAADLRHLPTGIYLINGKIYHIYH